MSISKTQLLEFFGLPLLALGVTFLVLNIDASVINSFPRSMQGESVTVPWSVCLGGVIGNALVLPWLLSLPLLPQPRARIYFLVCLLLALAAWYYLYGFDDLLNKAYRRGL
jgi:hypothetical protein